MFDRRQGDRRRGDRRDFGGQEFDRRRAVWPPVPLIGRLSDISEALSIRHSLKPGDLGWLVWLHGVIYSREQGWDSSFEASVAQPLAEFALRKHPRERIWIVDCSDRVAVASESASPAEAGTQPSISLVQSEEEDRTPPDAYPSIVGSIAIVEHSAEEAQLRWLLLTPELRGQGVGRFLVQEAIRFCKDQGYRRVFLWTTLDLTDAERLYLSAGFQLGEESTHTVWGRMVTEQKYFLDLTE